MLAASFGCPCHGGLYDSEGNRSAGPPVRSLDRYEFSIKDGNLVLGRLFSVGNVEGDGRERADHEVLPGVPGRARRRHRAVALSDPDSGIDGVADGEATARKPASQSGRSYPLDWLEERSGLVGYTKWFLFRKVPHDISWVQTLGAADADGVHRPGDDRRVPRDVLQAGSRDSAYASIQNITERAHARLARARHAQVGRERLHHPDVPPHGADVPVRRLQVPARAELDHRRRCSS